MILSGVLLNALLQIGFTYMVYFFVRDSSVGMVALSNDFASWRGEAEARIVQQVCFRDSSLDSNTLQLTNAELFHEYLGDEGKELVSAIPSTLLLRLHGMGSGSTQGRW